MAWAEWDEAEYLDCLESERRAYAWVMERHGGKSPAEARAAALEWYPYEPADAACRGLVFHDEAWHWAMLAIHGELYWTARPELGSPPAEYLDLD